MRQMHHIRHFTQATAVLPILQRQGRYAYNLAFGKYRSSSTLNNSRSEPQFVQSSAAIGLPYEYTFYGGIKADNYAAVLLGPG